MNSANPQTTDAAVDVLIVGAGGCGLVAALAAHEAGAEVAVVEKLDRLAGNTMLSSGTIPAAGTRLQAEAGIVDDSSRFAADLRRIGRAHDADHLVDRLAEVSADAVHFLIDVANVDLTLVTHYRHVGHSVARLHAPPSRRGADLMADLERAVAIRGIPLAYRCPVTDLLYDGRAVKGVRIAGPSTEPVSILASAVVLACNGFANNRSLLGRFCPDIQAIEYFGSPGSEGEAVRWGEALGARLGNMGAFQAHAAIAQPHGALTTWTVIEKGGVIIDGDGARFADESMGYSAFAERSAEHGKPTFAVYDGRIRDLTASGQPEFGQLVALGAAREASTIDDLARFCGCDARALSGTLEAASAAAVGERPDGFGRSTWGLGPLEPPYVATRITPALFHTQGGLIVDANARVLRADNTPIAGLFAGGGAACGISGRNGSSGYVSGNGLLAAVGLGFIAGRAVAAGCALRKSGRPDAHRRASRLPDTALIEDRKGSVR